MKRIHQNHSGLRNQIISPDHDGACCSFAASPPQATGFVRKTIELISRAPA